MVMGELHSRVDLAVIGGGVGGYVAAIRAAQLGLNVALVEKDKLGGHCLNYACIPSKTMIHISDILYQAKNSERFGISVGDISIDPKKMLEWRVSVSNKLEEGVRFLCKSYDIDVFKGTANFSSPNTLTLTDGVILEFKKAIVATGSEPISLKGFEFGGNIIDYKQALLMDKIPKSIAIIGAGYVSVEIGMMFAKLGSKVSIIARTDMLSKFDPDAVDILKRKMSKLSVDILTGVTPVSHDATSVKLSNGKIIDSEIIIVAVGLRPFTENLGLENTKVKLDSRGFIEVNEQMMTSDENILAIGDVIGEPMLAHKAIRQGTVAGEVAAGQNSAFENTVIPAVIFTDPEIAIAGDITVGEGIEIVKFPLTALGRAIALNATEGFVKIAYDSNKIVKGVEIVSQEASSMISEAVLAIEMGATLEDIADTIHPHPTYSEAVQEAAEAGLGRPIHFFYGKKST